jgi:uncharacterized protein (TIGR02099 family)
VPPPDRAVNLELPSRALRWFSGFTAWLWWSCVALASLVTLVWIAIYLVIVPRIDEFRPHAEKVLSKALGISVRIDSVSARVDRLMPSFEMQGVRLLDAKGRDALVLQTITAVVSPQSLFDLGFERLLVEKPELSIRRDPNGRITVAGLDVQSESGSSDDTSIAADWLFSQADIVIRSGTIRWNDELLRAPSLALEQVDVHLRNQGRQHEMRVDATPPIGWGSRFNLMGSFRGPLLTTKRGDWRSWQGQVFVDLANVDMQRLRQYAKLGVDVENGRGPVRGWFTLNKGKLQEVTADLALEDVSVRLRSDLQPLAMRTVSGRFKFALSPSDLMFSTERMAFSLTDGLVWPGGNVQLALQNRDNDAKVQGRFSADRLDLAVIAQISDRLPLDAAMHVGLRKLKPQGHVPQLQAQWRGPLSLPTEYKVSGRAQAIRLAASAIPRKAGGEASANLWHPGIHNALLDFDFTEKKGSAQLSIEQGSITLPGVFEDPTLPFERFSAELNWQADEGRWQVQLPSIKFSNADAQGEAKAHWQTSDPQKSSSKSRFPGMLDLQGSLARADGTKVYRYLPLVVPQASREYVRNSILAGQASQGTFKIKGDLYDMPFSDPTKGDFFISAKVNGASFDYVPRSLNPASTRPWPALTQIDGELIFDRLSMAVRGASARVSTAPSIHLSKVDASIADLSQKQQVIVSTEARGAAADVLGLINGSPLLELSDGVLSAASVQGNADVKLRLVLPIGELENSRVQGTVMLPNNDFQFTPGSPKLQQARGQVLFSERGFSLRDASARVFGGDVRIEGGSRPGAGADDVSVALRAQGVITAEGLQSARELGLVSRFAAHAGGSTSYTANMNIRRGVPEISVSSSLQGLSLNLPAPLRKAADSLLPLRYDNSLVRDSLAQGRKLQDQLSVELGNLASIRYLRDVSGDTAKVIRGRIGVGLASDEVIAGTDEIGVAANINFSEINIDAWETLFRNLTAPPATPSPTASTARHEESLGYLPTTMAIRARELTLGGRTLHHVVVGGSRNDLTWRANLDARELSGYVEYRQSSNNPGRVFARLSRLSLAASTASELESALDQQPSSIPALDIVIEDLDLRGTRMGRVEIEALNRDISGVREWRLSRLNVSLPEAQLSASGNWVALGAQNTARNERRRTALGFKLDINNAGELLKRLGQDKAIARGKGTLQGQIAWVGAPWALDAASMNGAMTINVENGQFLKADPGIAKLFGVLSLQTLPRRLSLDFRDVFSEGFPFDFLRGDVKIEQGIASTNNLQMKGVNAAVLMEGTANLIRETQDMRVVVVPEINAGTASLIATAINPAIGIGTFLAQLILRRPVIEAATQEFQITGSWIDPQVARVKRYPFPASSTPPANAEGAAKP